MSREAKVAGVVLWVLGFGLMLLLADVAWTAVSVVAVGVLLAVCAGFGALGWDAAATESGDAPAEPQPLRERPSWKQTAIFAVVMTAVLMGLGSLVLVADHGFGVLASESYWATFAILLALSLLISIALRYGSVTRRDVRRDLTRRRRERAGRPDDLLVLEAATADDKAAWRRRARRHALANAAVRAVLALPVGALLGVIGSKELYDVWMPLAVGWFAFTVLACLAVIGQGVVAQLRDPLVLVGRVTGGVHGDVVDGGDDATQDFAFGWVEHGYTRTLRVQLEQAYRLRSGGELEVDDAWLKETELPVRRRVHRTVMPNQDCALLCAGNGAVLAQVGDLARAPRRRARRATPA